MIELGDFFRKIFEMWLDLYKVYGLFHKSLWTMCHVLVPVKFKFVLQA
jgi:hypothetical protein